MSFFSKSKSTSSHSSYWLQDWEDDDILLNSMTEIQKKSHDIYKLAAAKRAISNFVNIVTNKQIPVKFNTRGQSYTDGESVVIGADVVEPKDFDVAVGLALHEGSHIKLSDFTLLQNIYSLVPKELVESSVKKGITSPISIIKDIWNYVEDRRIDEYVFNSAPGYREYYRSMYDKYFNDKIIDKGLTSDEYTEESIESYMFRLINLHNKNTDISKLKGLREIYKLVGLGTISRLKSTKDTFDVAIEIYKVILNNLPVVPQTDDKGKGSESSDGEPQNGEGNPSESDGQREMTDEEFEDFSNQMGGGQSPMSGDMDSESNGGNSMEVSNVPDEIAGDNATESSNSSKESDGGVKLSDKQKELLKKKIKKQKEFMNGDVNKKAITKKESDSVGTVEESGSEFKSVGSNFETYDSYGRKVSFKGVNCIIVNKLTKRLLESPEFPLTHQSWRGDDILYKDNEKEVQDGIRIGTILGKKLQVRGESRTTIYNRQKVGKIDKRLISSLGFGNENVFSVFETDSYKKANLHISIDASGSMGGTKWKQTITNVVALCKAVDMIANLSVQVSFRTTSNTELPYIVLAYDSRVDKFSKVKEFFPYLSPGGTTPEGLCFEAILNKFIPSGNDFDSYFLNLSDGEPYYHGHGMSYAGQYAFDHTKKMVNQIESMGIKTLSYFISDSMTYESSTKNFKRMYGKSASFVDVTNIPQITKTINGLFLQK
jgi:hypothetical protein